MRNPSIGRKLGRADAIALGLIVITGLALRALGLERQLWFDEAWVLDSVRAPTLHDMFYYQGWAQTTPPGVLLALRQLVRVAGTAPESLRWASFACGGVALGLAAWLVRRTLAPGVALVAMLVLALSPEVGWYATDIKQYVCDFLVSLVVMCAGWRYLAQPTRGRLYAWFALYGALCTLSYPAALLLPGMGLAALLAADDQPWSARARAVLPPALACAVWVVVLYVVFARPNAQLPTLQAFWAGSFWPRPGVSLPYFLRLVARELFVFLPWPPRAPLTVALGVALAALGAFAQLRRHGPAWALLLVTPFAALLGVNLLGRYPTGDFRMLYFLVPQVTLLTVGGVGVVIEGVAARLAPPRGRVVAADLLALAFATACAWGYATRPMQIMRSMPPWQQRMDIGDTVRFLHALDSPRVPVFVPASYRQLFAEYMRRYPLRARLVHGERVWACCVPGKPWQLPEFSREAVAEDVALALPRMGPGLGTWVLRPHGDPAAGLESDLYEEALTAHGCTVLARFKLRGVRVARVDCPASATAPPPP